MELSCPACSGLIEAGDLEELVEIAQEHCLLEHAYEVPRDHVVQLCEER